MFKKWFNKKRKDDEQVDKQATEQQPEQSVEQTETELQSEQTSTAQSDSTAVEVVQDESVTTDQPLEADTASTINQADEQLNGAAVPEDEAEQDNAPQKQGFFKKLFQGLGKTRQNITENIDRMLNNYDEIDDELFEELEEILITADVGMETSLQLVEQLKAVLVERRIAEPHLVKSALKDVLAEFLTTEQSIKIVPTTPTVILIIGVNGAGKTTSIGKIAHLLKGEGKRVALAAADTFRAAAIDQLKVWGERADIPVIAHAEGADPAAVVYDACQSAKAKNYDVLIVDTAGRLHNKVNLMNELNKIFRIIERELSSAHKEVLLVLDATTGQNALQQARLFKETAPISGLVITKLDGTAKGGFVFSIKRELDIPVKLICVGEKIDDLQHFDAEQFADALMQ